MITWRTGHVDLPPIFNLENWRPLHMNHIIETVGSWGVKTSPYKIRMTNPKAGDVVEFSEELKRYPVSSPRCRIDRIDHETKMIHLVNGMGSAFLCEDGSLSISGGPFFSLPFESLEPTIQLHTARFWNWGDNSPGADQGVDYYIARPVFKATEGPNDHAIRYDTSEEGARNGGVYKHRLLNTDARLVRTWPAGYDGLTAYLFDLKECGEFTA